MTRAHRLRALARIAWREGRRHRGRSLLVLLMIALPIAALTVGLGYFEVSEPSAADRVADQLGDADLALLPAATSACPAAGCPALDQVRGSAPPGTTATVRTSLTTTAVAAGLAQPVVVDAVLPDDPLLAPRLEHTSGRLPQQQDEALVAPAVQDAFALAVGDRLRLDEGSLDLVVTGTARRPEQLGDPLVLLPPGSLDHVAGAAVTGVFLDLPAGSAPDAVAVPDGWTAVEPGDLVADPFGERPVKLGAAFGLALLGLAETGLVVAAAFVVGTRRRLRSMGLVAAIGGEPRDARTIVLLEAAVLGLVGAVLGVAAGLLGIQLLAPRLEPVVQRAIDGPVVPVLPVVGAILLGTAAATVAVLGPARLVGRLPAVDALAGRTPPPTPPRRQARRGAAVALAGAAVIAVGAARDDELVMVLGIGAMLAGALLAIPLLVTGVGRLADRLPVTLRLAARDTARHGRRTGAAVAAAALALALPVTATTITMAEEARSRTHPPLDHEHLLVSAEQRPTPADAPAVQAALDRHVDVVAHAPVELAAVAGSDRSAGTGLVRVATDRSPEEGGLQGTLAVGGAALLEALGAAAAIDDLQAGRVVVVGDGVLEAATVRLVAAEGEPPTALPAVETGTPTRGTLPLFVVAPDRAAELGLEPRGTGDVLYRAATAVDERTLDEVRQAVAALPGIAVLGAVDLVGDSGAVQAVLLAVAVPVALGTLAVSAALVAAESRREQAILAAVGAAPGTRRKVVGAATLLLALLAAAVAVPAGLVPVTVMLQLSDAAYPVVVPWVPILGAVAAALLAGVGGLVLSREPAPAELLRPSG